MQVSGLRLKRVVWHSPLLPKLFSRIVTCFGNKMRLATRFEKDDLHIPPRILQVYL
jgi:hypothetical protein